MSITMTDIISIVRNIVDICLVWLIIYFILNNLKNNVKLTLLFKGVFFILLLAIVSDIFGFVTIGVLLDYIIQWGPIALIVAFQPEIRNILEQIGRSQLFGRHKVLTVDERENVVYQIVGAMDSLRKSKICHIVK